MDKYLNDPTVQAINNILEVADDPKKATLIFKNEDGERLYIYAAHGGDNILGKFEGEIILTKNNPSIRNNK